MTKGPSPGRLALSGRSLTAGLGCLCRSTRSLLTFKTFSVVVNRLMRVTQRCHRRPDSSRLSGPQGSEQGFGDTSARVVTQPHPAPAWLTPSERPSLWVGISESSFLGFIRRKFKKLTVPVFVIGQFGFGLFHLYFLIHFFIH